MKHSSLVNARQFILILVLTIAAPALAAVPRVDAPGLKRAIEVQKQHSPRLMSMAGVVGTAVGMRGDSQPVVKIYTERPGIGGLPRTLDGVQVEVEVTGKIFKLPPRPDECKGPPSGRPNYCFDDDGEQQVDPKGRFDPVLIGVSTGHPDVTAGTIGAKVTNGGTAYLLSNNHVYANEGLATTGDVVLQPGSYDGGSETNDVIGQLSAYEDIVFCNGPASPENCPGNSIDAAIAAHDSTTRRFENHTPSDGYGTPCSTPGSASVGQGVQKYGRTTGLTKGTVDAISATFYVGYDQGTARFVDQVVIKGGGFSKGGDSGSLVVDAAQNRPVALLFAGGRGVTIANPIGAVLGKFGISIDGVTCN